MEPVDAFVFENGRFSPFTGKWPDSLKWSDYLSERGYAEEAQVWGHYPEVYVKVFESTQEGNEFAFVAIVHLIAVPHRVFLRDLNGLVQLLNLVIPLFQYHSHPEADTGDALYGTHDAG